MDVYPYHPNSLSADALSPSVARLMDGPRVVTTFAHHTPGAALAMARGAAEVPALLDAIRRLHDGDAQAPADLFRAFSAITGVPVEAAGLSDEERACLAKFSGNPAWCRRAA